MLRKTSARQSEGVSENYLGGPRRIDDAQPGKTSARFMRAAWRQWATRRTTRSGATIQKLVQRRDRTEKGQTATTMRRSLTSAGPGVRIAVERDPDQKASSEVRALWIDGFGPPPVISGEAICAVASPRGAAPGLHRVLCEYLRALGSRSIRFWLRLRRGGLRIWAACACQSSGKAVALPFSPKCC